MIILSIRRREKGASIRSGAGMKDLTAKDVERIAMDGIDGFYSLLQDWENAHKITVPEWWDKIDLANYSRLAVREYGGLEWDEFQEILKQRHPEHFEEIEQISS